MVSSYLLDTGIIIRHLRGQRRAVRLLRGLGGTSRLAISVVTRLEVHAGMHPDERYATQRLLARFLTLDLNREVADRAGDMIYQSRLDGRTITIGDAIVAATTVQYNLTLVTLNRYDFSHISGISLYPIPD